MIVIWVLGSVIISRLHRFHITGTYVACFIAFAFLRSWITGSPWQSEMAPLTGPMYQLFIFFMITDPKTTVRSKKWQCIVVAIVALVEMILRLDQVVYAPFYALFLVGPTALLIEIGLNRAEAVRSRRARRHDQPLRCPEVVSARLCRFTISFWVARRLRWQAASTNPLATTTQPRAETGSAQRAARPPRRL